MKEVKAYRCEFCGKLFLRKHNCEEHEKNDCHKIPKNRALCYECKHYQIASENEVEDTKSQSRADSTEVKRNTFKQYTRYLSGVTRMLPSSSKREESSATHCIMTNMEFSTLSAGLAVLAVL